MSRRSAAGMLFDLATGQRAIPRPHLSMFERDPAVIAARLNDAQLAYLRSDRDGPAPAGTYAGTHREDGALTDRGRRVLEIAEGMGR